MLVESPKLFLIAAVGDKAAGEDAAILLRRLLSLHCYAFSEHTHMRKRLKPGDRICFYPTSVKGIVADAELTSHPKNGRIEGVTYPDQFVWSCQLNSIVQYFDKPVILDRSLRSKLDAFEGNNLDLWGWFVHGAHGISEHDFNLLIRR